MKVGRKYKFSGETMDFEGRTLQRIEYLRDFDGVYKGMLGGWIESEHNLSHEGLCCVLHEANVFGNASIEENSRIDSEAIVKDNAEIKGNSYVFGKAIVGADTICENTLVGGHSKVFFYFNVLETSEEKNKYDFHLKSSSIFGETIIEGTGSIILSEVMNAKLFGFIQLNYENIK